MSTHVSEAVESGALERPSTSKPTRLQWLVLLTVLGANIMDLLDSTIVNVAAPSVARDLHASTTQLQWMVAGYTLAMAAALITGGRLGDLFGRRRMFLLGIGAFTVFSALSSAAVDPQMLVIARVLQGLSAAIMLPQGLAIIRGVFPPEQAGAAMGAFGPVMGISTTAGPIIGGALVQANLFGSEWRSIFWINIPIGLLSLYGAWRVVPQDKKHGPNAPTLDVVGMLLSAAGMLLLVYPLIQGRDKNWPPYMFAMMAAAVPVLAVFWLQQHNRDRQGRTPLVTPTLFVKRAFSGGLVFAVFFFAAVGGQLLVLMLHLQTGLNFSSLHAGLTNLPFSVGATIGAIVGGGFLAPRFGRKVLHGGVALMAAGLAAIAWTAHSAGQHLTTWDIAPYYTVSGIGMGMLIVTFFSTVISAVDEHETGSASGVINATQQLANSLGVALFGTLYFDTLNAGHGSISAASTSLWFAALATALCIPVGFLLPKAMQPAPGAAGH